ncbi:hypothetical protein BDQ17DRAFT_1334202 [Cyathus striatus]|nr:hypothetical protein BDQ17DRAFT_1334202 [Cyathus striatus]
MSSRYILCVIMNVGTFPESPWGDREEGQLASFYDTCIKAACSAITACTSQVEGLNDQWLTNYMHFLRSESEKSPWGTEKNVWNTMLACLLQAFFGPHELKGTMISGDIYMKYATSKDEVNLTCQRDCEVYGCPGDEPQFNTISRSIVIWPPPGLLLTGDSDVISLPLQCFSYVQELETGMEENLLFPITSEVSLELQELIDKCCPLPPCWPSPMTSVDALVLKYRKRLKSYIEPAESSWASEAELQRLAK